MQGFEGIEESGENGSGIMENSNQGEGMPRPITQ